MALLEIDGVTKRYGGMVAVSDVSLTVGEGEIVGLIGPNGAGKTTLFDVITGIARASNGTVRLAGNVISGLPPHQIARRGVGRTFQIPKPFGSLTVRENVLVGALAAGMSEGEAVSYVTEVLALAELTPVADRAADSLTLPGKKRLEIAKGLSGRPRILLLDEVLAGLRAAELDSALELIQRINKQMGVSVLFVEHVLKAVMTLSHRIVVLHYGQKIAEGRPDEVTRDPNVIAAYLGEEEHGA